MIGMMTNIKALSFYIATFGGLGEHLGGSVIASLLGVPALFLLRMLHNIHSSLFFTLTAVLAIISGVIVYLALRYETDKDPSVIVIDKWWGFIIAFAGIQPTIKIFIVGFFLYHIFRFFIPILSFKLWHINFYELPLRMFNAVTAGVLLNLFFRLIIWIGS